MRRGEANILRKLHEVRDRLGCTFRRSARNVPMLVHECGGTTYSVAYFGRTRMFRIFWPYPSRGGPQNREDVRTPAQVVRFFESRKTRPAAKN